MADAILPPELVARIRAGGPVQFDGDAIEALCDSHERLRARVAELEAGAARPAAGG